MKLLCWLGYHKLECYQFSGGETRHICRRCGDKFKGVVVRKIYRYEKLETIE